jgi:hypothetical protein
MMIMILGFGVVVFLLVSVVVGASQYFVYHRALHAAADGAALAGTNGIDTGAIYDGGVGDDVILSQQAAQQKVDEYVSQLQSRDTIRNFRCPGVYVAGSVVTVECNGDVQVPIVNAISSSRTNPVTRDTAS